MSAPTKREWYYLAQDQRHGPVSMEEITKKLMAKEIFPEDCHVWKQGMKDWEILEVSKPFVSVVKAYREREAATDARAREAGTVTYSNEASDAVGITRGVFHFFLYVGWLVPMLLGIILLCELQVYGGAAVYEKIVPGMFVAIPLLLSVFLLLKVAGERLSNAGYSKKMALALLVPLFQIWVLFLCLFAPPHFKSRKKLDFGALVMFVFLCGYGAAVFLFVGPRVGFKNLAPHAVGPALEKFYKDKSDHKGRMPSYKLDKKS